VGLVKDRSSLALRGLHVLGGVIDSGYRGEIKVVLVNFGTSWVTFNPGDRVAQLVVLSLAGGDRIHEADDLSPSDRGEGGFGSTGE
jgi:dUTP pyrophosphatase